MAGRGSPSRGGRALLAAFVFGRRRENAGWPIPGLRLAVAAGVADVGATIALAIALQPGSLVLVGVLGAMFPVVTVVLDRVVLRETLGRMQVTGLACAVVAVGLITLA